MLRPTPRLPIELSQPNLDRGKHACCHSGAAEKIKNVPPEAWMELPTSTLSPFNKLHALLHPGVSVS